MKLVALLRWLLGLPFVVVGLNGFFDFLPLPETPPSRALDFTEALKTSGYLWELLHGTQIVAGLLLLSGQLVPLALTLLAPILLNIACFHVFLDHRADGQIVAAALVGLEIALVLCYRAWFRGVLTINAKPFERRPA